MARSCALRTLVAAAILAVCAGRRFGGRVPLAAVMGDDGQEKKLQEYMFAKEWVFEQSFAERGREKWRKSGAPRRPWILRATRRASSKKNITQVPCA